MDITKKQFESLKKQYNQAVKDGATTFIFEGNELVVSYAKYLIEFLSTKF